MSASNGKLIWLKVRTLIFGSPLQTQSAESHRLGILGGIPVFGSDVISSQGYAPDEILLVLLLAGSIGYAQLLNVSLVIVVLLASVLMVYRKAIQKYPQGGGSYTIAHAYLGENFGLLAGACLTLDYVLTVAVSISSSVENLTGVFPWLAQPGTKVLAAVVLILFMTVVNLRGLKESARLFAVPVYLYILSILVLVGVGLYKVLVLNVAPMVHIDQAVTTNVQAVTLFMFARAVAGGTTALTGTEAVSNGVTAFKAPAQKNAISTLFTLGIIVAVGLVGMVFLAGKFHIVPTTGNTVLNQLGGLVFGQSSVFYYVLMGCAALILIIAANTPFVGLPILLSLMAKDGYTPRYFKNLGDRLVYSAGIWTLSIVSIILVVIFQGRTHSMLPLYAMGVFIGFSLTGIGLAKHVWQERGFHWQKDFGIFSFGGVLCFIVFAVFLITKFREGAWAVIIILPILICFFRAVSKVYKREIEVVKVVPEDMEEFKLFLDRIEQRRQNIDLTQYRIKIVVPVFDLNKIVLKALQYAYELTPLLTAVHVGSDPVRVEKLKRKWEKYNIPIHLEIVESPYRATVSDLVHYLDGLEKDPAYDTVTLVMPEYVPLKIWQNFLHNQTGQMIKFSLLLHNNILVTSVPFHPPN